MVALYPSTNTALPHEIMQPQGLGHSGERRIRRNDRSLEHKPLLPPANGGDPRHSELQSHWDSRDPPGTGPPGPLASVRLRLLGRPSHLLIKIFSVGVYCHDHGAEFFGLKLPDGLGHAQLRQVHASSPSAAAPPPRRILPDRPGRRRDFGRARRAGRPCR